MSGDGYLDRDDAVKAEALASECRATTAEEDISAEQLDEAAADMINAVERANEAEVVSQSDNGDP